MAAETMLLDENLSVETGRNLWPGRARGLCHQFTTFFKIGRGYDWEEQYNEYSEYWENHFQARQPE